MAREGPKRPEWLKRTERTEGPERTERPNGTERTEGPGRTEGPNELNTKTLFRLTVACLCGVLLLSFLCYLFELKTARLASLSPPEPLDEWVQTDLEKRVAHLSDQDAADEEEKKTVELLWTTYYFTYDGTDQSLHARAAFMDDDENLRWLPTIVYTALDGQDADEPGVFKHAGRYLARVVCDAATRALLGDEYVLPADRTHEYVIPPYALDLDGLELHAEEKIYDGTTAVTFTDVQICLSEPFEGQEAILHVTGALISSQSDFAAQVTVTNVELINTNGHRTADFDLQGVFDLCTPTTVLPLSINAAQAEFEGQKAFTGEEQTFEVRRVRINGLYADFTVQGNTATDIGAYVMTVTGIGNFTGTLELPYSVVEPDSLVTVATISDVEYTGETHTPNVQVNVSGRTLQQGRDYVVTYSGGLKAGTATATVMLQGEYSGSIERAFSVKPKNMAATETALLDSNVFIYTGEEITPYVTVMDGNRYLKEAQDYDLIYVDNVNPGTGSVIVKYKGNYEGEVLLPFEIKIQNCTMHWFMLMVFMILVSGVVGIRVFGKTIRKKLKAVAVLSFCTLVMQISLSIFGGCLACTIISAGSNVIALILLFAAFNSLRKE